MNKHKYYIAVFLSVNLMFFTLLPSVINFFQTIQEITLNQKNIVIDFDDLSKTETEESSKSSKSSKTKLFEEVEDCIVSHFIVSFIHVNKQHNFLTIHKKLSACCLQIFSPPPNLA